LILSAAVAPLDMAFDIKPGRAAVDALGKKLKVTCDLRRLRPWRAWFEPLN